MRNALWTWMLLGLLMMCSVDVGRAGAAGQFKGDVVAKWLVDGREMELSEPFGYIDPAGRRWNVPKGTRVNGASIPRILWTAVGAPYTGKYRKASVIHDYFGGTMERAWRDVHLAFFYASLTEGNTPGVANLMYAAVYSWGPRWEYVNGTPVRLREDFKQPTLADMRRIEDWIKSRAPNLEEISENLDKWYPR